MEGNKLIIGVFPNQNNASDAINRLDSMGFNPKDISILMRSGEGSVKYENGHPVITETAEGATVGGIIGALTGLVVGAGILPGLGVLLIGGPLAASLGLAGAAATTVSGAVTGIVAGGVIGALVSLGIPENEVKIYENSILQGGILIAVPTNSNTESTVENVMKQFGGDNIQTIDTKEFNHQLGSETGYQEYPYMGAKGGVSKIKKSKKKTKKQ